MTCLKHIFIALCVLFLVTPDAAMAQRQRSNSWQVTRDEENGFRSAGFCNEEGACVRLICQTHMPNSLLWQITAPHLNPATLGQESRVTWMLDEGTITFLMQGDGSAAKGFQDYDAYFNPDNPYAS